MKYQKFKKENYYNLTNKGLIKLSGSPREGTLR